jgi:hypothetical protein
MKYVRSTSSSTLEHNLFTCYSVVREINKINERELELGVGTASWHDEYKGAFAPATRVSVRVE